MAGRQEITNLGEAEEFARSLFRDLADTRFEIPKQGDQNWVLMTPTDVVRFSRSPDDPRPWTVAKFLASTEAEYLPRLLDFDQASGALRMTRLPGRPLREISGLSHAQEEEIGEKLGVILADFHERHQIPTDNTTPPDDGYRRTQIRMSRCLSKSEWETNTAIFNRCGADCGAELREGRLVMAHGDLTPGNILYDDRTKSVALIDPDGVGPGSRQLDLAGVAPYSDRIARAALAAYNRHSSVPCREDAFETACAAHKLFAQIKQRGMAQEGQPTSGIKASDLAL